MKSNRVSADRQRRFLTATRSAVVVTLLAAGVTAHAASGAVVPVRNYGTNYDRLLANGQQNVEAREQLVQSFMATNPDAYDFLVTFTDFDFNSNGAEGFNTLIRNDVQGIGWPIFMPPPAFGALQRLSAIVDLGSLAGRSVDPGTPAFRHTLAVLAHELGHRFLGRAQFRDASGRTSGALLSRDGSHWSFFANSDASLMYGNTWRENGDGTFTSTDEMQRYSWLDLYLMGLARPDEVPPTFVIEPAKGVPFTPDDLPKTGVTIAGTRRDVTIEQIIAATGARVPAVAASQKVFHVAFVLHHRSLVPSSETLARVDALRRALASEFFYLTRGRAILDTELVAPTAQTGSGNRFEPYAKKT